MARADSPRQPLIILSEAGFPDHVSSPWRTHRGARFDDSGSASAVPYPGEVAGTDAGIRVPVAILNAPVTRCDASGEASTSASRDVDAEVAASPDALRRLGMLTGDLVAVCSPPSGKIRAARIVASGDAFTRESVRVSPCMAANLGLLPTLPMGDGADSDVIDADSDVDAPSEVTVSRLVRVPRATHVEVSPARVPAPLVPPPPHAVDPWANGGIAEYALGEYFRTPRLLATGDSFIATADVADEASATGRRRTAFHFTVRGVRGDDAGGEGTCGSFLVGAEWSRCTLLSSAAAGAAPPFAAAFAGADVEDRLEHAIGPGGSLTRQVRDVLAPAMHPQLSAKFRLKTAALVTGAAGVGKRSAVKTAAASLGAAFVCVSCHELVAEGGNRRLASVLAAAFDAAAAHGPAVLYLRRFGALASAVGVHSSGGGGGGGEVAGVGGAATSAVAQALRRAIVAHSACGEGASSRVETLAHGNDDEDENGGEVGRKAPNERVVILVAGCEDISAVPESLRQCFTHEIEAKPPTEADRLGTLRACLGSHVTNGGGGGGGLITEGDLKDAAAATSGAMARDTRALAAQAAAHATDPSAITADDLKAAVKWSEKRAATAIGTPSVPTVKWDDVGGLDDVKAAIRDVVELPLRRRDLVSGSARSGALLYGPPGTGKTLLAKAVATECALRFLSVKGPELVNMYVGESEKNVRDVFERARHAAPCVVFFDELDALAPARGAGADSGGVMDRVVSQLLAELDGANAVAGRSSSGADAASGMLFVIGATNRPDLVDPALLRPGRFDRLLYVGVDETAEGRSKVLAALTKKFALEPPSAANNSKTLGSLDALARKVPRRFTGADMYALCADAWTRAAKRTVREKERDANDEVGGEGGSDSAVVVVRWSDFGDALSELTPSLTDGDLAHYRRLREEFEGDRGGRGGGR